MGFNSGFKGLNFAAQSYRLPTDSKAQQLGVAGGDNSTAETRLRPTLYTAAVGMA